MLTLVSSNAHFDKVMLGKAKFNKQQANGFKLFNKNCNTCHKAPLFSTYKFENNGLPIDKRLKDFGRMKISKNNLDSLKFKVPSLRNIAYTYPYMHDGRFTKLSEVIDHYRFGVQKGKTLSKELKKPIVLNENEKVDLICFLLTLSDTSFVFNKNHQYPRIKN